MAKKQKEPPVSIRLSQAQIAELKQIASSQGITKHALLRRAVSQLLKNPQNVA